MVAWLGGVVGDPSGLNAKGELEVCSTARYRYISTVRKGWLRKQAQISGFDWSKQRKNPAPPASDWAHPESQNMKEQGIRRHKPSVVA